MITCCGLVVCAVSSENLQDILNQCCAFLKKYRHLLRKGVIFEEDGVELFYVMDWVDYSFGFNVMFYYCIKECWYLGQT